MRSRRSSPTSRAERRAGFSLIELLVALFISGITLASAVGFFATHARTLKSAGYRLEAQQAMRGSLDAITRDLRLAGACLPLNGQFVAIDGQNIPGGDSITIRTGLTRPDLSCIWAAITVATVAGANSVTVNDSTGITPGQLAYVTNTGNVSGEFVLVSAVAPTTVSFATGLGQPYPVGGSVYAVDERVYRIDASNPDLPLLTLTVNRGIAQAFSAGMRDLQIVYILDQGCPACVTVDLPASVGQWRLVNEVDLTATVETVGGVRAEDEATMVATSTAKPRNLLP
jgi:prepilin-type N-terminal cleavage/methylation domain-containing protein